MQSDVQRRSASSPEIATVNAYSGKRERTRLRLIAAATQVLAREGVSGATVGKIAAEAGVVPGTVYHNFGSRDALVDETLASLAFTVDDGVAQARAGGADPAIRMALAAAGLVQRALDDRLFANAFGRLARRVPQLQQMLRNNIIDLISDGIDSGRFAVPTANLRIVADALLGVAVSAASNAAAGELSREDRSAVAQLSLAMLGLGAADAQRAADEACAIIDAVPVA